MKNIVERFISYTRIDTTSADDASTCPSTPNQFILARQLEEELKELNLKDVHVDEHAFVYATVPANSDRKCPVVGFLAHMDTSNMASGADIKARIIENYDGGDIELSEGIYTRVKEYPKIAELKGHDIIVTDGTTLLGGDDKAGIAIIMDAIQNLVNDPDARHGEIRVCFTPDEEIGAGIHNIRLEDFPCEYAYTVDGGDIDEARFRMVRDDPCQRRLAYARRTPEDHGRHRVLLDDAAQHSALPEQMLLSYDLVDRLGAQPGGQRLRHIVFE